MISITLRLAKPTGVQPLEMLKTVPKRQAKERAALPGQTASRTGPRDVIDGYKSGRLP